MKEFFVYPICIEILLVIWHFGPFKPKCCHEREKTYCVFHIVIAFFDVPQNSQVSDKNPSILQFIGFFLNGKINVEISKAVFLFIWFRFRYEQGRPNIQFLHIILYTFIMNINLKWANPSNCAFQICMSAISFIGRLLQLTYVRSVPTANTLQNASQ